MELANIRTFISVVRAGGFAPVARERGVAASSISRAIHTLEESLGVRLLHRTTRTISLTEAGEAFLLKASPAIEELEAAKEAAFKTRIGPAGHLRISASVSYGNIALAPLLKSFVKQYPEISLELILSDNTLDIIGGGIDLAIRHGPLADSSLIGRRLRTVEYYLVANSEYIENSEPLNIPGDLLNHQVLNYTLNAFRRSWRFEQNDQTTEVPIKSSILSSNPAMIRSCACNGMGVALLADWIVEDDLKSGKLQRLLPDWNAGAGVVSHEPAIWLIRPSRAFVPEKVIAFESFLRNT